MKRLIFLVLFFYNLQILKATTYYVDNNSGNDSNNGLSKSNAWQTLNKVNSFSFLPNDSILFACGDVWRGQLLPKSGSSLGNITYASYGMGAKPQLLGSVDVSNLSNWINIGGNIWQSIQASSVDVGNLICNGGALCGKKKWTAASLLSQGDFWWDKNGTHKVGMYSATNPGLYYTDIEAALGNFIVYMSADSFVVLQNMALKYGAADGIEIRNTHHASILDCELSYIGGTELTTQVRYGGGIQFWAKSHDNRVERCKLWEIYE